MSADIYPDHIISPESVDDTRRAEAARLMAAIGEAEKALREFAAPSMGVRLNLGPGETIEDWGAAEFAPTVLVCPWCREKISADALYDREIAERWSYAREIDGYDKTVAIHFGSSADFDSVVLVHELCGLPVEVPEGWEQVDS